MKAIFMYIGCLLCIASAAQTKVNKTYPVRTGQQVELTFDYPKIVRISTWDKNEVAVTATVNINEGENDNAFELLDETNDGKISIRNIIRDMKSLPKRYTVVKNGLKSTFKSKEDFQSFMSQNRGGAQMTSEGVDMEIVVEVKVPANTATNVKATYGIVELVNFNGPATVNATYGGIDATVTPATVGRLQATTHYGKMFTNLDLKLTAKEERDFYSSITAEPGKGPEYILKSTYGNLYLRKQ